jgi:hypothetical protein
MFCPTSEALAAYHQGTLQGDQRASISEHIVECPYCSREIELLKQLTNEALAGRSPPGLWNIMNAATNGHQHTGTGLTAGRLRRVLAELLPPAPGLAAVYGAVRGAGPTSQYAYHAENLQITIGVQSLAHHVDRRIVVGVLAIDDDLPEVLDQATASLFDHDQPISTTDLDELGNFVLDNIDPGTYRLSLRLSDREVVIEALTL